MSTHYTAELLPKEKVFRDPVHDYIHIQYRIIMDLINAPEFQRLRRIKQLGTSSYTFHGAEHSRSTIHWASMKSPAGFAISSSGTIPAKHLGMAFGTMVSGS